MIEGRVWRLGWLGLALMVVVEAPRNAGAGQLKIVIAADEEAPTIGPDMRVNRQKLERSIAEPLPRPTRLVYRVPPGSFRAATILDYLRQIPARPDDAFFFYYSGHGGYDPVRRETYLLASGDSGRRPLFVSEVRSALEARGTHLRIVVLDCCNTLRPVYGMPNVRARPPGDFERVPPLFDSLFFRPNGSILIESSAPGEYAIVEPELLPDRSRPESRFLTNQPIRSGSLFTNRLAETIDDRDPGERTTWASICRETQASMDVRFDELKKQGVLVLGGGQPLGQARQNLMIWADGRPLDLRVEAPR